MSPIARFYITHCLLGFLAAGIFTASLLYLNVANLWHLISTSDIGLMALVVFWILNGIVFAGVQTGIAVMMMAEDEDDGGPRGGTPIPIRAPARRRD
ncbi:MAG: hypothetical protein P1U53_09425 [Sulfitobacter sp.]|nr:hypothetical protein [Sulfitobacter sp.]